MGALAAAIVGLKRTLRHDLDPNFMKESGEYSRPPIDGQREANAANVMLLGAIPKYKAEGRKQKAEGADFCFLLSAFCFSFCFIFALLFRLTNGGPVLDSQPLFQRQRFPQLWKSCGFSTRYAPVPK
jgi:hypothetical protein